MLPTITSADLGHPTEAGEYRFGEATVRVDSKHIEAWRLAPTNRINAILRTRLGDDRLRFALGHVQAS